jgi:hypothetical protein
MFALVSCNNNPRDIDEMCLAFPDFNCHEAAGVGRTVKKYHLRKNTPRPPSDGIDDFNEFDIYVMKPNEGEELSKYVESSLPGVRRTEIGSIISLDGYILVVVDIRQSGFELEKNKKLLLDFYGGNNIEILK